jgi:hypothetical protein
MSESDPKPSATVLPFCNTAQPPFALSDTPISPDLVQTLRNLNSDAASGELIGIAVTAMYREGRGYRTGTSGELYRNPTFAIGTIVVMLGQIVMRVLKKTP